MNNPVAINWRTPIIVIIAGCLIAMIGFGVRSVFGLFLEPMTVAKGWDRETFALAMAIQNLIWGAFMPLAGAIADRHGPVRVIFVGSLIYACGIWGMAEATAPLALHLFGGLLMGLGVAFTSFSLVLAAMARVVGPAKRSLALGLGTAAGSLGQVVFSPISQGFIGAYGWKMTLLLLAASALIIIPLATALPGSPSRSRDDEINDQSIREALKEAVSHHGYILLTFGFFVCGFHVAFITVHFPAYIMDIGLPSQVGAYAIAIIGLFNIIGAFLSGVAGQRWSKKSSLSLIYFTRAVVISLFLLAPDSEISVYLFAGAMGVLWLSTVPLTTGIVAQVFGVRYMATLFGIVFFSHQVGSFFGIWLGGRIHDVTGSYDNMWLAGVALGIGAAIIHLPIDERALSRLKTEEA